MNNNRDERMQKKILAIGLYETGMRIRDIAVQIGKTPKATQATIYRLCAPNRRRRAATNELKAQIAELNTSGKTDMEIAKLLQMPQQYVSYLRIKVLHLPHRDGRLKGAKERYQRTISTHGTFAERRHAADKYNAWLDGSPKGLTTYSWRILRFIQDIGDTTAIDIAKAMCLSLDCVRRTIKRLATMKLVVVSPIGNTHGMIPKRVKPMPRSQHDVEITKPAVMPPVDKLRSMFNGKLNGKQQKDSAERA